MQREAYPYIVYHILPLCTSAFWRFGNPACMIFILFKSFRFARAKQTQIFASSVPKPILYPRNVHSYLIYYTVFLYFFSSCPFTLLSALSPIFWAGTAALSVVSAYSYIIYTAIITYLPHTKAKIPRGYAHFLPHPPGDSLILARSLRFVYAAFAVIIEEEVVEASGARRVRLPRREPRIHGGIPLGHHEFGRHVVA